MSITRPACDALRGVAIASSRSARRALYKQSTAHATQFRAYSSGLNPLQATLGICSIRPGLRQQHEVPRTNPASRVSRRTLFIQTETTPNADALKFMPQTRILPEDFSSTFLEYLSPRSTLAPPHPSQLASQLMAVDGVTSVFYGADYITVTKDSGANWGHVKPEVFSLITEAVTSGQPIVKTTELSGSNQEGADEQGRSAAEEYDPEDEETVLMIKELLDTRIRPAIQEDGGDVEFRGFKNGWVMLKLRGACRTCDSSTVTLRNGIESMLMHYIEDVKGIEQVMDQEEEIAMAEFAKFEEKLKQQKGQSAAATSAIDQAPA